MPFSLLISPKLLAFVLRSSVLFALTSACLRCFPFSSLFLFTPGCRGAGVSKFGRAGNLREEKKKLGHRAPAWSGAAIAPGPRPMGKGKRREVGGAAHARRRRFRSGGGEKTRERESKGGFRGLPGSFPVVACRSEDFACSAGKRRRTSTSPFFLLPG